MAPSPQAEFARHTGWLADPAKFGRELGVAGWLYLCGERQEFREPSDEYGRAWARVAR